MRKFKDTILLVCGGLMLLLALMHVIRLGSFKTSDVEIVLLLSAGFLILTIGAVYQLKDIRTLRNLAPSIVDWYKKCALFALNCLIIFICLDLAARVVMKGFDLVVGSKVHSEVDPRQKSSYYRSQPWAAQYWSEFLASRKTKYYPYVLWRRVPFQGSTINVDKNGVRVTPGAECGVTSFKVFTFGGSPVWGTGSPDQNTIPAHLQSRLASMRDGPICVTNFGESAYVSTQGVIQLVLQLQSGNIPNVVIFYDGINDVYTAYQSGRSNVHENFEQVAAKFEGRDVAKRDPVMEVFETTSLLTLSEKIVGKLSHGPSASPKLITYETMGIDAASLSKSIVNTYSGNYGIVDALAHRYGFQFVFLWPPHITYGEKPLTAEEQALKDQLDPALVKLYRATNEAIKPLFSEHKNFSNLANVFSEHDELLWIDDAHVTPVGNEIVANKILRLLTDMAALKSQPEVQHSTIIR